MNPEFFMGFKMHDKNLIIFGAKISFFICDTFIKGINDDLLKE